MLVASKPSAGTPPRESLFANDTVPAPELLVLGDTGQSWQAPSNLFFSAKQVMKMIMTLNVQESGRVKYVKRPGAVLETGCVVARLELDDPSKVHPVCGTLAWLPYVPAASACSDLRLPDLASIHPQQPA